MKIKKIDGSFILEENNKEYSFQKDFHHISEILISDFDIDCDTLMEDLSAEDKNDHLINFISDFLEFKKNFDSNEIEKEINTLLL